MNILPLVSSCHRCQARADLIKIAVATRCLKADDVATMPISAWARIMARGFGGKGEPYYFHFRRNGR